MTPRTSSGIDRKQRTILVPTLGLKREEPAPPPAKPREDTVEELRKLVLKVGTFRYDSEAREGPEVQ